MPSTRSSARWWPGPPAPARRPCPVRRPRRWRPGRAGSRCRTAGPLRTSCCAAPPRRGGSTYRVRARCRGSPPAGLDRERRGAHGQPGGRPSEQGVDPAAGGGHAQAVPRLRAGRERAPAARARVVGLGLGIGAVRALAADADHEPGGGRGRGPAARGGHRRQAEPPPARRVVGLGRPPVAVEARGAPAQDVDPPAERGHAEVLAPGGRAGEGTPADGVRVVDEGPRGQVAGRPPHPAHHVELAGHDRRASGGARRGHRGAHASPPPGRARRRERSTARPPCTRRPRRGGRPPRRPSRG